MPQLVTPEDVKAMLLDQRHRVAEHYAPAAPGSYHHRGQWFTLNPGRADRKVGSFVVNLDGPRMGTWHDFSTGEGGDLLDLIRLSMGGDLKAAFREARSFLGLGSDSPEDLARRKAAAARAGEMKRQAAEAAAAEAERSRRRAFALWLEGRESLRGTPAEAYLRDARGIDLAALGRQPGALRFHPGLAYEHKVADRVIDPETGEVLSDEEIVRGTFPAILSLMTDRAGKPSACHITWLGWRDGLWGKAPVPRAKKIRGVFRGAAVRVWRGLEPSGRRGRSWADIAPGSRAYVTEGIEDALSVVMALPEARVLAAGSLSNIGNLWLPPAIAEVTIVADLDAGPEARAALERAVAAHARAGRTVRKWQNRDGGKDVNDALRGALRQDDRGQVA